MNTPLARAILVTVALVGGATAGCIREHGSRQALPPTNRGPTISEIKDQQTIENVGKTVSFTVDDPDTPLSQLQLSTFDRLLLRPRRHAIVYGGRRPY